jgi:hypothetical protein
MRLQTFYWLLVAFLAGMLTRPSLGLETETSSSTSLHPHREKSLWVDVDQEPLPFQKDEEVLEFLRTAEAKSWKPVGVGINKISKVLLEKDGVRLNAAWRIVDERYSNFRLKDVTTLRELRDSCFFEVAAYRLGRLLGLRNIPPAVERTFKGEKGTLQLWLEGCVPQTEQAQIEGNPSPLAWSYQNQMRILFDSLLCNVDRNRGNILIGEDWKLWLIDHTRAFQRSWECKKLETVRMCDREFFKRLKELDEKGLRAEMKGLLKTGEVSDLLRRRAKIITYFEDLIAERGEDSVLF